MFHLRWTTLKNEKMTFSENNNSFMNMSEAVARRCSVKKVFLEISQNSQKNTCARVSLLIKCRSQSATLLKKRLWHRCFYVNFAKFLRTSLITEHLRATASDMWNVSISKVNCLQKSLRGELSRTAFFTIKFELQQGFLSRLSHFFWQKDRSSN